MPKSAIRFLRWLALLPAIYISWHLSLLIGLAILAIAESFCPRDQMVSGLCIAPWFLWVEDAIFAFGAALAATLIVITSALIAPGHKARTACAVFLAGCLVAAYFGWTADALKEFVTAALTGFVTLLVVNRRTRLARADIDCS